MKFAVFLCVYACIRCYLYRKHIYGVNYAGNKVNPIQKNPGLLFLHSFPQFPFYRRGLETN